MNRHAKQFFEEYPDAKYFYVSQHTRFPNPKLFSSPGWEPDPWPQYWHHNNRELR